MCTESKTLGGTVLFSRHKDWQQVYLERLLASMNKLGSLQFTRFNKSFPALCTDVNPRTVGVEVFSHRGVVSEHFGAALWKTVM